MSYITLCRQKSLVEGELAAFAVAGREVLVVWPDGAELKAYDGTCPHQRVPLRQGEFNGRIITCPAHQWVFDGRTGLGLSPTGCALRAYPLRIESGLVQVDVSTVQTPDSAD